MPYFQKGDGVTVARRHDKLGFVGFRDHILGVAGVVLDADVCDGDFFGERGVAFRFAHPVSKREVSAVLPESMFDPA